MNVEKVVIINENRRGAEIAASGARISTRPGTALEILERAGDTEKDMLLLHKVLASGHRSVIEHQTFSVAFNDVSVMVEQFMIEFRLASFTVKSRRYVDFSSAGYVIPEGMSTDIADLYKECMGERFSDYEALLAMGIPKEDARFVLPYSLRSNFIMTVNARELVHMVYTMAYGRGAGFPELRQIGKSLEQQLERIVPGMIGAERRRYETKTHIKRPDIKIEDSCDHTASAELIGRTENAEQILNTVSRFSGTESIAELLGDVRPRALEALNYTFLIRNCSLACLTHFTRHRIQSPVIPEILTAALSGSFVLPESIHAVPEAEKRYREAFAEQTKAMKKMVELGASSELLFYFCMSGHQLDMIFTMNARELAHFARLRTCTRAQWEIRAIAEEMMSLLSKELPVLFGTYGPSCAMDGRCPEGKMSCGHPVRIENGIRI